MGRRMKNYVVVDNHGNGFMIKATKHEFIYSSESALMLFIDKDLVATFIQPASWFISTHNDFEEKNFQIH